MTNNMTLWQIWLYDKQFGFIKNLYDLWQKYDLMTNSKTFWQINDKMI